MLPKLIWNLLIEKLDWSKGFQQRWYIRAMSYVLWGDHMNTKNEFDDQKAQSSKVQAVAIHPTIILVVLCTSRVRF